MPKLKLGPLLDEKPVRLSLNIPAALHRDLVAYADALSRETGQSVEPLRLVGPMLERFLASDRGFKAACRRPTWAHDRNRTESKASAAAELLNEPD